MVFTKLYISLTVAIGAVAALAATTNWCWCVLWGGPYLLTESTLDRYAEKVFAAWLLGLIATIGVEGAFVTWRKLR